MTSVKNIIICSNVCLLFQVLCMLSLVPSGSMRMIAATSAMTTAGPAPKGKKPKTTEGFSVLFVPPDDSFKTTTSAPKKGKPPKATTTAAFAPAVPVSFAATTTGAFAPAVAVSFAETTTGAFAPAVAVSFAETTTGAFAPAVAVSFAETTTGAFAPAVAVSFAETTTGAFAPAVAVSFAETTTGAFAPAVAVSFAETTTGAFAPAVAVSFAETTTGAFAPAVAVSFAETTTGAFAPAVAVSFAETTTGAFAPDIPVSFAETTTGAFAPAIPATAGVTTSSPITTTSSPVTTTTSPVTTATTPVTTATTPVTTATTPVTTATTPVTTATTPVTTATTPVTTATTPVTTATTPVTTVLALTTAPAPVIMAAAALTMAPTVANSSTTTALPVTGLQHAQLSSLLVTVLEDYDRRIRPRRNQKRFVAVFSDFIPFSIIEFKTQEQKFAVMGYFKMDWRDDFLTWDANMYEGTKSTRIPVQSIWTPKLSIDKAYDGNGIVGEMDTDIALVNFRGYVRWFPEGIYSVSCKVTIRFYPFDIQTCDFAYFIADEDNSTINLKHDGEVDLSEYIENAEWKLTSLTTTRELVDNVYVVNFKFEVERRGGFAMFTLVVPVLMLSMLSGATFLIPIESGEKCSFSVTIFLAYGIFETIVIDTLPHNSLDVSYFILYITSLLVVSVLLTFYTILQAKIFDAIGDREIGGCRRSNPAGDGLTWGKFLRSLDTFVFVGFLLVVAGFSSMFAFVMGDQFDFV